jgi:predicted transcriptional regulator
MMILMPPELKTWLDQLARKEWTNKSAIVISMLKDRMNAEQAQARG